MNINGSPYMGGVSPEVQVQLQIKYNLQARMNAFNADGSKPGSYEIPFFHSSFVFLFIFSVFYR